MRKYLILLLPGFLISCSISRKVPYEYQFNGKVYKGLMQRGKIIDTSYIYRTDKSVEKIFVWKRNGDQVNQTLLSPQDTSYRSAQVNPRNHEGIEKIIHGSKANWKSIYNRYLKVRPGFRGKIEIRIVVDPQGNIEDVFILKDTTGYPEFSQEIINVCTSWRFEKTGGSANDWITFPLSFFE